MNIFLYLPPVFSIYLILVSGLAGGLLRSNIKEYLKNKPDLKDHEKLIVTIADDWAEKLGFVNSMILSAVSIFAVFSESQSYLWAGLLVILIIGVFVAMFFWVFSHQPGKLVGTKFAPPIQITHAQLCQIVLIMVNVIIIFATYQSIQLSSAQAPL